MPTYKFLGRRYDSGTEITGERLAQNSQALAAALRAEKIMPIRINEKGKGFTMPFSDIRIGSGVSSKQIALFTRQFSVMIDAGLPLVQCLSIMAEQQENKVLKKVLYDVREEVEAGATLADAMAKHPRIFDGLYTSMVAAGEAGGVLDVILQRLSIFVEKTVKLKRALMSASVYPSVIVLVAIVIVFVIMIFVIPTFATLFEGLNAPLPLPTRLTIWTSNFLAQFILPIMAVLALLGAGVRYYHRTDSGRMMLDRLKLKIPVFGSVVQKITTARFSRTLATLLSSGIPILESLEITARTAGNRVIHDWLMRARQEVEEGKTLAEPLKKEGFFPPMVVQMIGVGEHTGELDQMLEKLADYYEEESDTAIANFLTLLEPLMIVFLGTVIGGIVISMYLPIFTLIGRLSSM